MIPQSKPASRGTKIAYLIGGLTMLVAIAALCLYGAMTWMVRNDARSMGKNWSVFVERNLTSFSHLLMCRKEEHVGSPLHVAEANAFFADIFEAGTIFHVDIYGDNGLRSYAAGQFAGGRGAHMPIHAHETELPTISSFASGGHTTGQPDVHGHEDPGQSPWKHRPGADERSDSPGLSRGHPQTGILSFPDNPPVMNRVMQSREIRVLLKSGTDDDKPTRYAEVYYPVVQGDRAVGLIRLFLNMEEHWREDTQLVGAVLLTAFAFFGLSFGLPMARLQIVSRRKADADAKAHFLASHDPLTGLMNRRRFLSEANALDAECRRASGRYTFFYLDLDHFKQANDALGHGAGDDLLVAAARRIADHSDPGALIARMGGDEFALMIRADSREHDPQAMAHRIAEAFADPVRIDHQDVGFAASIGYAVFSGTDRTLDAVVKKADTALYWVKRNAKGGYAGYRPEMDREVEERQRTEAAIRAALRESRFELHFQPQISLITGRVSGFEALVRMRDDSGKLVPPADFIPIAEETGSIAAVGEWVLRRALEVASDWPDHVSVAVNVSPAQFNRDDFFESVRQTLQETGFEPQRLENEITENLIFESTERNIETLNKLSALGVSLAMDDFGTGYSSLATLWRLPVDKLKVDRTFMRRQLNGDLNTTIILKSIVELAHRLNMTVIAEGVETIKQVCLLRSLNCDFIQGYFYSHPLPEAEIAPYLIKDLARFASLTDNAGRLLPVRREEKSNLK
ncbi:MAG: bifunctional diguanylate cyclase/phosphodiesterase [Pseudomonadota bacterium]